MSLQKSPNRGRSRTITYNLGPAMPLTHHTIMDNGTISLAIRPLFTYRTWHAQEDYL